MNLEELTAHIEKAVLDDSFDPQEDILQLINVAIFEIASEFRLPDLITSAQITFAAGGDNFQQLPDNYLHNLFQVNNLEDGSQINIRTSSQILDTLYEGTNYHGPIQDVAVDGGLLWSMPKVNEDQTLVIRYYRAPASLSGSSDVPEGIPPHLHRPLIVNYALKELYSLIEDGIEGRMVNTELYMQKYNAEGLVPLARYCRATPRKRPVIRRSAVFF